MSENILDVALDFICPLCISHIRSCACWLAKSSVTLRCRQFPSSGVLMITSAPAALEEKISTTAVSG